MMGVKLGPDGGEGFVDVERRSGEVLRLHFEIRRLDTQAFRTKLEFKTEMVGEVAIIGIMSPELPSRSAAYNWVIAKAESIAIL